MSPTLLTAHTAIVLAAALLLPLAGEELPQVPDISAVLPAEIGSASQRRVAEQSIALPVPLQILTAALPKQPDASATPLPAGSRLVLALTGAEAAGRDRALGVQERRDRLDRWLADGQITQAFYEREQRRLQELAQSPEGAAASSSLSVERDAVQRALQHRLTTLGHAVVSRLALDAAHRDVRDADRAEEARRELDYLKEIRASYAADPRPAADASGSLAAGNAWTALAAIAAEEQKAVLLGENSRSGLGRLAVASSDDEASTGVRDNVEILRLVKQKNLDAGYLLELSQWQWSEPSYVAVAIADLDPEGKLAAHPAVVNLDLPTHVEVPLRLFTAQAEVTDLASGAIVASCRYRTSDAAQWSAGPTVVLRLRGDRPAFAAVASEVADYRTQLIKQQLLCSRNRAAAVDDPDDAGKRQRYIGDLDILKLMLANPPAGAAEANRQVWSLDRIDLHPAPPRLGADEDFAQRAASELLAPIAAVP